MQQLEETTSSTELHNHRQARPPAATGCQQICCSVRAAEMAAVASNVATTAARVPAAAAAAAAVAAAGCGLILQGASPHQENEIGASQPLHDLQLSSSSGSSSCSSSAGSLLLLLLLVLLLLLLHRQHLDSNVTAPPGGPKDRPRGPAPDPGVHYQFPRIDSQIEGLEPSFKAPETAAAPPAAASTSHAVTAHSCCCCCCSKGRMRHPPRLLQDPRPSCDLCSCYPGIQLLLLL